MSERKNDQEYPDEEIFTLESILKEFGRGEPDEPPAEEEPVPETPQEQPEETAGAPVEDAQMTEEEPTAKPETEPEEEQNPREAELEGDTIRLDDVVRQISEMPENLEETRRMEPLGELDLKPEETNPEAEETDGKEPFAEDWEPEYEVPMGQYVPPEPIVFHPGSRLKELKRKLVAGPEKRYYDLSELGLGKLQITLFMNALVVLLSAGLLVCNSLGCLADKWMPLMVYGQVLAMLLSALLGAYRLIDGASDLFHGKFSMNTLLLVTFVVCAADGVLGLKAMKLPFCAAFSLEMSMAIWAEIQRRRTEMGQMDTLRKAIRLDSVVKTPGFYQSRPGFLRGEGEVEDFMDTYQESSAPEKTLSVYSLSAMAVALCIGLGAGALHRSLSFGVHAAAAALLAAVPVTAFIAMSRPADILEKRLHGLGTVLCGWRGVVGMSGAAAVPLSDADIFPAGSVKMNGVKFYGTRDPDQVVAYGCALIAAEGGGLTPVFDQLLESRNGIHYDVENLRSYDSGGLGGEVCGEPVLVGVLPFLQEMGVDMPEGTRVNQAVYVAIDGELSGVFAITYNKARSSAAGLTTLCGYRSLTPVLTSRDFMLTESFLRSKFGINTRRMEFPDRATRSELSERTADEDAPALALTTQDGLAPAAFAITGAKALRTSLRFGAALHMFAGIVGLIIVGILAVLGNTELLSPSNLLLFEVAWMIPGLLVTEWTRMI